MSYLVENPEEVFCLDEAHTVAVEVNVSDMDDEPRSTKLLEFQGWIGKADVKQSLENRKRILKLAIFT